MPAKKKSLADELADLFNPAPTKEFDPEADVFGAGPTLEESDEELAAQPARRRGKEADRLRGDIVLEGREYAGRRTSRAALFGDGEEEEGEEAGSDEEGASSGDEGSEEEGEQPGSSGSEEEAEEEEEDGAAWLNGDAGGSGSSDDEGPEEEGAGSGGLAQLAARKATAGAGAGSDSEGEPGGGSSDEEGGGCGAAGAAAAAADDEMAALEREYEAMQQDEQTALAGLKERAARERKKAVAVQAQKAVWQRGLEARILLQRALAGANRLPQGAMQGVAAASSEDLAAAFTGLAADASALLGDLLELLDALAAQNPAVAEAAAAAEGSGGARKRTRGEGEEAAGGGGPAAEALWGRLDEAYAGFAPFRDASIDRWHRKTALTTGGTALRGGQLKALNQSISTQVAQLMQDPGKVLQRTRLPRSAQQQPKQRVLCPHPDQQPAKRGRWSDDEEEPAANGVDATGVLEEERDPETFDDTEFYQTLLREFLEGSADAGGGNWHTGPKQRKNVDRRASKGRKLRYHVHPKLVNFMTPVELDAPQFAAQLFSNLFGGGGQAARK